jgi:hypothetical protein
MEFRQYTIRLDKKRKNKEKIQAKKSKKAYEKEISDLKLENEFLKELLKKN